MAEWLRRWRESLHLKKPDAEIPLSDQTKSLLDKSLSRSALAIAELNPMLFVADHQFHGETQPFGTMEQEVIGGAIDALEQNLVLASVGKGLTATVAMLRIIEAYDGEDKILKEIYGIHANLLYGQEGLHGNTDTDQAIRPAYLDLQRQALEPWLNYIQDGTVRRGVPDIFDHHLVAGRDNHSGVRVGYYFAQAVGGRAMLEDIEPETTIRFIAVNPPTTIEEIGNPGAYSDQMIRQMK